MKNKNDVYKVLQDLNISFEKYEHPAVFTVAEAEKYDKNISAGHSKNLFLRNQKASIFYLIVVEASKRIEIKKLENLLGERKLSFGSPEKLLKILGLTPGSVSPFGLINDEDKQVHVIIDTGLLQCDTIGFHPNINTTTLVIKSRDFKKFLEWTGNKTSYYHFE